ncbi:GAF domain-containing protein [Pseudonocardia sp. H11422]|uniref:GAF domain-containing protein n=1 Tax=Pseudonocardia sp. H11422 TaxID=2835866 RepID=UPI0027E2F484|nr:GAF domain-containing protein [Pseudonocardia sp. H11422]
MDDGASAVRQDTDLRRHARMLHRTHDAMLTGDEPPMAPRGVVARSWTRMRVGGVNPDRCCGGDPVSPDALELRRHGSPLTGMLYGLRASLVSVAEEAGHLMVVTDADGMVLWREGCPRVRRRADALGFTDGVRWTETTVGTNAIGTALVEGAPVQLFSAEHFARTLHSWTCTASPVHDPRTGQLLGIVDVSGSAATVHPATVALVRTAVRLAEADLWREREVRLESLRTVAGSLLGRVHGPAAVVDDDGWVAAVSGIAPTHPVAAPVEGEPCAVPGIGTCVPEPVPGGWLLRREAPGAVPLRLGLDIATRPPSAVVEGTTTWRHPLTLRHAEVLVLLMRAGDAGMNAFALSQALFGDHDHVVTVRAEVSRLRRKLGGLLLTRPYRITPNVIIEPCDAAAVLRMRSGATPTRS